MEFTRPIDRDLDLVRKADEQKEVKYSRLRQALERTLQPGWKVQIATLSIRVRGTIVRVDWKNSFAKVGVPTTKHDHIAHRAILDALKGFESLTQARSALDRSLPTAVYNGHRSASLGPLLHRQPGPSCLAVKPLGLYVVYVGSIPTGPTHAGARSNQRV